MYICHCNKCNNNFLDKNPSGDERSINYPEEILDSLIQIKEIEGGVNIGGFQIGEIYWSCPNCLTDEYLADNKINANE